MICSLHRLQTFFNLSEIWSILTDFAYKRYNWFPSKTSKRRVATSSHAAFEGAVTNTESLVDRMISEIAATNVLVLPVPMNMKY